MVALSISAFAFILGFALARASTCSVAATKRLVLAGKADWFYGLAIATSWSGLVILALSYALPMSFTAPTTVPIHWTLFAGAAVMGVGAYLNRACFIGSVGKIGIGNLSYLLTFAGLAAAQILAPVAWMERFFNPPVRPGSLFENGIFDGLLVALFALIVASSLWRFARKRTQAIAALIIMGVAAAMLYSGKSDWSYAHLIERTVQGRGLSRGFVLELSVAALFSGAILSSALRDRFKPHFSSLKLSAFNFIGGVFMGLGEKAVPGGNDNLILWSIPGHALHAIIAFLTMIAVVAALVGLQKGMRARSSVTNVTSD